MKATLLTESDLPGSGYTIEGDLTSQGPKLGFGTCSKLFTVDAIVNYIEGKLKAAA